MKQMTAYPLQTLKRRAATRRPVGLGVAGVLFAALALSFVAAGSATVPGDIALTRLVQRLPDHSVGQVARLINAIGETPVMILLGVLTVIGLLIRRRVDGAVLIGAAILARGANPILKAIFASPRPASDQVRVDEIASGWGFPSGHVMGMTLFIGALLILTWETWPSRRRRRLALGLAALMLLACGLSRIYVGAHWPSDVLGGYLWGGLMVSSLASIWRFRAVPRDWLRLNRPTAEPRSVADLATVPVQTARRKESLG